MVKYSFYIPCLILLLFQLFTVDVSGNDDGTDSDQIEKRRLRELHDAMILLHPEFSGTKTVIDVGKKLAVQEAQSKRDGISKSVTEAYTKPEEKVVPGKQAINTAENSKTNNNSLSVIKSLNNERTDSLLKSRAEDVKLQIRDFNKNHEKVIKNRDIQILPTIYHCTIKADKLWSRTGIRLKKGDRVMVVATGRVQPGHGVIEYHLQNTSASANGYDFTRNHSIMPSANYLSLIAKIGKKRGPFFIGERKSFIATEDGLLYLGVNEKVYSSDGKPLGWSNNIYLKNNEGRFAVEISRFRYTGASTDKKRRES